MEYEILLNAIQEIIKTSAMQAGWQAGWHVFNIYFVSYEYS